jgi:ABC-2 type transport system permease protein
MRTERHAEWTKLRTVAESGWLLLGTVGLTIALGAAVVLAARCPAVGCDQDAARLSLSGVVLGQAIVVVLAVTVISGEYSTGMIRTTLAAMPRRESVLCAKAVVLTGVVLIAGVVAVLGSFVMGRIALPHNGFTADHGYSPLSLGDGPTLRAVVGSVVYLVLIGLLSVGIATAVRESAAAVGSILGLLYLFPILTQVITDPDWHRRLQQIAPMSAGLTIQATTDLDQLPVAPWAGLGVLALWSTAAMITGALRLRWRDV